MVTDRPPRPKALRDDYTASDRLTELQAPDDSALLELSNVVADAMKVGKTPPVKQSCSEFLATASDFYQVQCPSVKVLASRPLRVREGGWATELFGDYDPESLLIRVWMRTAVQKKVTSHGTFLSTLVHELCHHLDFELHGFQSSPHTRGFYERVAVLYHHAKGTPRKRLFWTKSGKDVWRIDWARTNRGG